MPNIIKAECPRCNKKAKGIDEISGIFGWRTVNRKKVPQSHCNECRSKSRKKKFTDTNQLEDAQSKTC